MANSRPQTLSTGANLPNLDDSKYSADFFETEEGQQILATNQLEKATKLARTTDQNQLLEFYQAEITSKESFDRQLKQLSNELNNEMNALKNKGKQEHPEYLKVIYLMDTLKNASEVLLIPLDELAKWMEFFLRASLSLIGSTSIQNEQRLNYITCVEPVIYRRLPEWELWVSFVAMKKLSQQDKIKKNHPQLPSVVSAWQEVLPTIPAAEIPLAVDCCRCIHDKVTQPSSKKNDKRLLLTLNKANKFPWGKVLMWTCAALTVAGIATMIVLTSGAALPVLALSLFAKQAITGGLLLSFASLTSHLYLKNSRTSQTPLCQATNATRVLFAPRPPAPIQTQAEEKVAEPQTNNIVVSSLAVVARA